MISDEEGAWKEEVAADPKSLKHRPRCVCGDKKPGWCAGACAGACTGGDPRAEERNQYIIIHPTYSYLPHRIAKYRSELCAYFVLCDDPPVSQQPTSPSLEDHCEWTEWG